ncbi:unnamed protein product [Mytilus coruscus]|uniref:CARD domain-containing protein n=1 Tax=Mytilus coruscus TaxID=42192 RepID=A0A6J8B4Y9_MYTCO|nr:unnamed protein product [Mytilus coruscus]
MESRKKEVTVLIHMENEVCPDAIELVEETTETRKNTVVDCYSHDTSPNYDEFLHNVTLDTTVLDGLISKCYLTIEDREEIMNQQRLSERNRMILDMLMARPYRTFQIFTEELIEFDRSKMDLVSKMKNYDCDKDNSLPFLKIMDHTIQLQKNFKMLVNELATTNIIVDHLISDEVLCSEDQAEICASNITKEQSNRLLLTKLMYKDADACRCFLSALKGDTCDETLARRIEHTDVTEEDMIMLQIGRTTAKEKKEKYAREHHNVLIDQWINDDETFVCTRAADEVLKRIKNDISVIVSGNSGVGKTATMRHVALLLKKEGFRIIPTSIPEDLRNFSQKGVKTLFVIDDICGHFTLKEHQVDKWEEILAHIQPFLEQNPCKIIATCRLQVFKDAKFKALSLFDSSECNLNSEPIKLTTEEKSRLAEMYFKEHANEMHQKKKALAQQTDIQNNDSSLLLSSFIGNVSLTEWVLENAGFSAKSKNLREVLPRMNKKNYIQPNINMRRQNGTTSLYIACENGHLQLLKVLLKYRADPTLKKNSGDSSLSVACENGHTNIVSEILGSTDEDKDYQNRNGYSPMYFACQNGHVDIVQILIKYRANINLSSKLGVSPLFIACEKGYLSIVKNLLINGADINCQNNAGQVPLHAACYKNHIEVVRILLENDSISVNVLDNKNISPIYATCQCSKGHFEVMEQLLQHNADVNNGRSPLIMTCENGNTKMSEKLIERKADVNACFSDGVSPLFMACQNCHYDTVCLLLKSGADPNVYRKIGASPLIIASQNGDVQIVDKLLQHKSNINSCTDDGVSSLYLASQNGHLDVVCQLIEAGANLDTSDSDGKTALFKSCQKGHRDIVSKLLECKADINLCMKNNVTPMEIADKNNHSEVVSILKKHASDKQMSFSDTFV